MATITTGHTNRISSIEAEAERIEPIATTVPASIKDMISHAAKSSSRYAIGGVLVERDGDRLSLAATDGHRLAIVDMVESGRHGGPDKWSVIVPTDVIRMLKVKPADREIVIYRDETGGWELRHTGQILPFRPIDGNFPPYRDIMPKYRAGDTVNEAIGLSPKYLAEAAQLADRFNRRAGGDGSTWHHARPGKPATLKAWGADLAAELLVVIMPRTLDDRYAPERVEPAPRQFLRELVESLDWDKASDETQLIIDKAQRLLSE